MTAFVNTITQLPSASAPEQAMHSLHALEKAGHSLSPELTRLVNALAGNSEFLARLIERHPNSFMQFSETPPEQNFTELMQWVLNEAGSARDRETLMQNLREARSCVALLLAMADVSGYWHAKAITAHLSQFADLAIQIVSDFLLREANDKGMIALPDYREPSAGSGLIILAMGKLGGGELNYSSDIDLIILFDDEKLNYNGRQTLQHFYNRFAQDLSSTLQDRTRDGYVFRTDLRLRPDPRSTPLAVKLRSAITYYESLGQNWERAAMIKARAVYADADSEAIFAQAMQSFIWRRHLDFAAIADIDSIKRQINTKIGETLQMRGHHVKLGHGGIREIEFYLQTQQLIWGGRDASLRAISSDEALHALHDAGHINEKTFIQLREAYWYLRRVEHYIQMRRDQQDHTIPTDDESLQQLACFLGYKNSDGFEADLLAHCRKVHKIYAESMDQSPPLSYKGNLVFTGVEADPDTLKTLAKFGFSQPETISDSIQSWHRGGRRATRSLKARQLLTELTPSLLNAFADTPNPDDAFLRFDEFISKVPVGVQIFSLLTARPEILSLLATILGCAPAVCEGLARNPSLLDILLDRDLPLTDKQALQTELEASLHEAEYEEESHRRLRQFKQEKNLHAGVKLLTGDIKPAECGRYLSDVADVIIGATYRSTLAQFEEKYGVMPGGAFALLALGKLGTCELTFGSDLDLIMLYDAPEEKLSADAHIYYQRFANRLSHAFTLLTPEGRLYELDMRLRPGGNSGPLATHIDRLASYLDRDGWDVEALGLTRARIAYASSKAFAERAWHDCLNIVERGFEPAKLANSILALRERISQQHPSDDPWDIKFQRGGLMDISFLAQYIRLTETEAFKGILGEENDDIFMHAASCDLMKQHAAKQLAHNFRLQRDLQHVLRLSSTAQTISQESSASLQKSVARLMGQPDCDTLMRALIEAQKEVLACFNDHITAKAD